MVSSSNSTRKQQSLARVAVLGPYAGIDQPDVLDPAVRTTTPLTALENELRGRSSNDSIGAVVATRPDAEVLTRKRERRRSIVSSVTSHGGGSSGAAAAAAAGRGRRSESRHSVKPRRTSIESVRSRDRASLLADSVTSSSSNSHSHSSESPSPTLEAAGRQYLYDQLELSRAEGKAAKAALCGGDSSAVIEDSDHERQSCRISAVLRPSQGNARSFKAKSEAGYYFSNDSREKRRQSRAYPPMVQNCFFDLPQWASSAMEGVDLSNDKQPPSSSSSSHLHDRSGRRSTRSSTATVTATSIMKQQDSKTPTEKPRGRKRRGAVSTKSVSGATDDQEDAKSAYSGYSTATFSHYPRGEGNPYCSAPGKRTSWRLSSGVESSRAQDLAAVVDLERKLEQTQEKVRELERERDRERERERERRRRQKQKQKEILRVDSVNFEMCSPPATTTTPRSPVPQSPIYDMPTTKSRRMSCSSRPMTAVYSPPSQEPAASFDVVGVYRTETVAKHELEPVDVLSRSNFLDGKVYDNSNDADMVAAPEPSDHHRRSRRYSRGPTTTTTTRSESRSSCRSLSPARMLEKSAELADRMSVALHDFKEDQKARAGIIPPDPNREYPSFYNGYGTQSREMRDHRAPEQREHHRRPQEDGDRHHQRHRVRRSSLQQQQQPSQTAPAPAVAVEPPSSPSSSSASSQPASSSFASRMAASANTSGPQQKQRRISAYRPEKASETMPHLNDVAQVAPVTRREQERQELFCRSTQRGGRPEHFLRQPGVGNSSDSDGVRQQQKAAPPTAMAESPSAALRLRTQEKINGQRLSGLDYDFDKNSSSINRLDSLCLPRSNKAAATANASVPESHR
ncbi:hypothetical protein PG993_000556 [Apiospora rasikravindrae]|uniref:Uncharacterized protein n=1 Tax=Apiospora rasikravindrae TaxID=990691 RepID=A0ABR1U8X9_9PEZI